MVLLQQRGPGPVLAVPCLCHCHLSGSSLAGLGEALL